MAGLMNASGGANKTIYIDRIVTTSTGGYTARIYGYSAIFDPKNGSTSGSTGSVGFSPYETSGTTDYGTLGLANTTFSYTPKYSGYYFDGNTAVAKKIEAGTKLSWSYSVAKDMLFMFFDIK